MRTPEVVLLEQQIINYTVDPDLGKKGQDTMRTLETAQQLAMNALHRKIELNQDLNHIYASSNRTSDQTQERPGSRRISALEGAKLKFYRIVSGYAKLVDQIRNLKATSEEELEVSFLDAMISKYGMSAAPLELDNSDIERIWDTVIGFKRPSIFSYAVDALREKVKFNRDLIQMKDMVDSTISELSMQAQGLSA